MDEKEQKKLFNILTKITNVSNDVYILKQGYVLSIDIEKPFLIQLDESQIELFNKVIKDFKIIRISDIKKYKKDTSNFIYEVTSNTEKNNVIRVLDNRLNSLNMCESWENFLLSDNAEENEKLIYSVFKENNYVNFTPNDNNDADIILTKSLLPLVTEKNYTKVYYSSKKLSDELFIIVFDIDYDLFRLCMFHNYIKIPDKK